MDLALTCPNSSPAIYKTNCRLPLRCMQEKLTMACGKLALTLLVVALQVAGTCCDDAGRKPYIVYLGGAPESKETARIKHRGFLSATIGDQGVARDMMIHSYVKNFNAFAAMLRPEEASKLSGMDGIISVFPSASLKLHTTRSWDFLGLPLNVKRSVRESNVIVGLLDTGTSPHSPSLDDKGFGPPPSHWKGKCDTSHNFTCNNKIIGAKYYRLAGDVMPPDIPSPVDTEGHGTHTSSTAAGSSVARASLYGLAGGTARGAVPSSRVAVYKVCWSDGCQEIDLLAAFDDAISDGVDVISASIGGFPGDYFADVISIGSFHAMKRGVLTCLSAGNDGPSAASVSNVSPWALTVGASSIDRQFRTDVGLGNGQKVAGISLNTYSPGKKMIPVIKGADAGVEPGSMSAAHCLEGSLEKKKVKGKIVCCNNGFDPESTIQELGGAGVIKLGDGLMMDVAFAYTIPSATVGNKMAAVVAKYVNTTRNSQAVIYKSRAINVSVPFVASFSSRGPNSVSNNILKPDVAAPGLDILAAWSPFSTITGMPGDTRKSGYNIISGTSMACPHVSGAAAYIKSFHPRWSPAAIKSAIMTTAKDMSSSRSPEAEFGYGSGQIDPLKAVDPGLVYDMDQTSYINFLCKQGYDPDKIAIVDGSGGNRTSCSEAAGLDLGSDGLNYPTMQHSVKGGKGRVSTVFRRTVTNVGEPGSVYRAVVSAPKGMTVKVSPSVLAFAGLNQRKSFKVAVDGEPLGGRMMLSASLVWTDSKRRVRSPIVITMPYF